MKKTLSLMVLFGALTLASAQTATYSPNVLLYTEDWGAVFAGTNGAAATNATHEGSAGSLPEVGWSVINIGAGYSGGYIGIDAPPAAPGVNMDIVDGITTALSTTRDIYVAEDNADQGTAVMIFTTDTNGAGPGGGNAYDLTNASFTPSTPNYWMQDPVTGFGITTNIATAPQGDMAFTDINPANYSTLTFSLFAKANSNTGVGVSAATTLMSNYFAVQISNSVSGNAWYISTSPLSDNPVGGSAYTLCTLTYNSAASHWNNLTVVPPSAPTPGGAVATPGSVTIPGTPAASALSGIITGFGVVQPAVGSALTATATLGVGFQYKLISITTPRTNTTVATAPKIDAAGYSQTTYQGGNATFAMDATVKGTDPTGWIWYFNNGASTTQIANGANGNGSGSGVVVSGSATGKLLLTGVGAADMGTYYAEVTNATGNSLSEDDWSTNYNTNLTLTVLPLTSPVSVSFPSGNPNDIIYAENFPYVGPFNTGTATGSLSNSVGWTYGGVYPNSGFANKSIDEGDNMYFYASPSLLGWYYTWVQSPTSSATESGLPFPAGGINPANYPAVSFRASVSILDGAYQTSTSASASAYFMVQMTGGQWYVNTSAMNWAPGVGATNTIYGQQFSTLASGWETVGSLNNGPFSGVFFPSNPSGTPAPSNLSGNIIGVGVAFDFGTPGLYTLSSVMLVTNTTPPLPVSFAAPATGLYQQTVDVGGGTTFAYTEGGAAPFVNNWYLNDGGALDGGTLVANGVNADGSIYIGATNTSLTIENAQFDENGFNYDPTVSNPAGPTNFAQYNATYGAPYLTVVEQPVGTIYSEYYPIAQALSGNVSGTNFGWTAQSQPYPAPGVVYYQAAANGAFPTPNADGFAYMGTATNSLFYAATTTDNGYSGVPFIAFDPSWYPAGTINFSATIGQSGSTYTNVQASFAIEQGGQWYVMAAPLWPWYTNAPPGAPLNTAINTVESQTYVPTASAWKVLTFQGANGVAVGGTPSEDLSGEITASGLLFQGSTAGTGTLNWSEFQIQASGVGANLLTGGVNINNNGNGTVTLTWIGNDNVELASTSSINSPVTWTPITSTKGQHSYTVAIGGADEFYAVAYAP